MKRFADSFLQLIFVFGVIIVIMIIYFTRISGIRANDEQQKVNDGAYADFQTFYQFQQEEIRLNSKLAILKAEYAADVNVYQRELQKVQSSADLTELEKREKIELLQEIYSNSYFDRKLALIDQEKAVLEYLLDTKCQKFCVYQDLPESI